jgi:hypothetical protein
MAAPLTAEQKAAGRIWRDGRQAALDALNADRPPGMTVLTVARVCRHACGSRGSRALVLREHYETSPDGLLAFIWRDGHCSSCGMTARSSGGRVVLAAERPPLAGAAVS